LIPKKVKHRKWHKGRARNIRHATDKIELAYGPYGLKAMTGSWISSQEIEAGRRVLTRYIKKGGKVWIRVFPDKPITKKPQETRMGKGKGAPEEWVAVIKPGRILFEMEGVVETDARAAMRLAAAKLPIATRFATRFAQEKAS
jgi:large subunit ribosomal protein L16